MAAAIAVTRDLLFSSKITGTAQALGVDAKAVGSVDALSSALDDGDTRLVMVDMSLPQDVACACLRAAADHPSSPATLAYYSHVDASARTAAQSAGAQIILPRSSFSTELPELIRRHCLESNSLE